MLLLFSTAQAPWAMVRWCAQGELEKGEGRLREGAHTGKYHTER